MAIKQISENQIKENYQTLDEYTNKPLIHGESDLYYVNGSVYKIFNKVFRRYRQSYTWILDENKFNDCINVENLLYQGDKLIGIEMKYFPKLITLKERLENEEIELYEANKIYEILLSFQNEILKHNLSYIDATLNNITFYDKKPLIVDIDGAYFLPDKNIIEASYKNIFKNYLSIILRDNIFQYEVYYQDKILSLLNNENIYKPLKETEVDLFKEKYYKLKKDR